MDAGGGSSSDGFDLGPSWFWPGMHARMAQIIDDLGLRAFPQHAAGDVVVERSQSHEPQRFPPMQQEPQSMRLAGGTGALVSALLERLPRDRLHPGCRVTRIAASESGLEVSCSVAGEARMVSARQAILALPPRLLARAGCSTNCGSSKIQARAAHPLRADQTIGPGNRPFPIEDVLCGLCRLFFAMAGLARP